MVGALVAGALLATGCAKSDDGAQVHTGSSTDVGDRLTSAMDATLGGSYLLQVSFDAQDANGRSVSQPTVPLECLPTGQPTTVAVDPATHKAFVASSAGPVIAEIDRSTNTLLVARSTYVDPSLVPAPWVHVPMDDPKLLLSLAGNPGIGAVVASLLDPEPDATLDAVRRSLTGATEVGAQTIDGEVVTDLTLTLDGPRFRDAQRASSDAARQALAMSPVSTTPPSTSSSAATSDSTTDALIDGSGHLRRLVFTTTITPDPTATAPGARAPVTAARSLTFSAIGAPMPTSMPPTSDVVDLGTLPAAVLAPRPACDALSDAYVPPSGMPTEPSEWRACLRQQRDQTYAGKTVDQYLAGGGKVEGGLSQDETMSIGDLLDETSNCPMVDITQLPTSPGVELPTNPDGTPILSIVPGTIPGG